MNLLQKRFTPRVYYALYHCCNQNQIAEIVQERFPSRNLPLLFLKEDGGGLRAHVSSSLLTLSANLCLYVYILLIHTISISILCVSLEGRSKF